jgi:hypothetical protein
MDLLTDDENRSPRQLFHGSGPGRRIVSKEFAKRRRNALSLWEDRSATACEKWFKERVNQSPKT